MRVFAVSDIHIDYRANFNWLMDLSESEFTSDILILAGDISDKFQLQEKCFRKLQRCFRQVLYIPGNHDLWVDKNETRTSLDKFAMLLRLADEFGIATRPCFFDGLAIVPLFAWYDFSFGDCSEYLQQRWMDFFLCRWSQEFEKLPAYGRRENAVCEYFLAMNNPHRIIDQPRCISFSHFLPRIDVMPNYIPEIHRRLYPILGTSRLDHQIRALGSTLHIYGHSHVNRDVVIDGVRYVNSAYGNPGEERISAKNLLCVYSCP